jgi:hypothetical protein
MTTDTTRPSPRSIGEVSSNRAGRPNRLRLGLRAALLATVALPAAACSSSHSPGGSPPGMDGGDGGSVESGSGDSATPGDAAPDDAGACGLLPVAATCTAASQCCQSGSGLPEGQACFSVSGAATRTCRPRCNSSSECAAGSCCIPDSSSFPPLGSPPTEPGGFCYPEAAGSAACIVGDANGYVCTGNDSTNFVCTPAVTDAGPSGATCLAGVTTYCACAASAGQPCSSSAESVDYAECIDGAPSVFACYAGYESTADAAGCAAAGAACGQ